MDDERRNRIKVLAAEKGLTIAELAVGIGVQPHTLRRYTRHEAQPRLELADKIADFFGCTREDVLGETRAKVSPLPVLPPASQARNIPVYGAAQGGAGFDITDVTSPVDYIRAPEYLSGSSTAYAVLVVGDSMEPRFCAGETLFVHPGLPPRPGDDVVLQLRAGAETHSLVKRFVNKQNGGVIVKQLNPDREVRFDSDDVIAVHKIVGTKIT